MNPVSVQNPEKTRRRVVVALSGGVDSAAAAAILTAQGYDVVGVMLRLWSEPGVGEANRCCTLEATQDARRVAWALDIPFYLLDCEEAFREHIVDAFIREHAAGRTPNPCVVCNRAIKFGFLLEQLRAFDADALATGHYARVVRAEGEVQLWRARDPRKDQSYVLHVLEQAQLRRVLFPLGDLTKAEARALVAARGLPVAAKPESQDLCFVRDQDYRRFLREHAPAIVRPGPILDRAGRELGQHQGLPLYTIGQRRGIGIAGPAPLYVLELDVARNALIVGPAEQLGRAVFEVRPAHFISGQPLAAPLEVTLQVRYTGREVAATLTPLPEAAVRVQLSAPCRDVTPGQSAVFYHGAQVLGGGVIHYELGG